MSTDTIVLTLAGLTAALLVMGVAQLVLGLMPSDEQRVKERLAGTRGATGGSPRFDGVAAAVLARRPESRLGAQTTLGRFERRMQLVYPDLTVGKLTALSAIAAAVSGGLIFLILGPALGAVAGLCGAAAPVVVVNAKRAKRERTLSDQLVEALDFLARVLRAGHSLATGLKMCGEELPEPIATEFVRCYQQHTLGQSIEDSLTAMAARMDLTDFNFFVTSVVIQRQTGGDLAEILDNIARMIRSRIQLGQQVRALTSEGRATGAVLTALPVMIFVAMLAMNPKYASVLLTTEPGRMLMALTIVLLVVGQVLIRRIVAIKV
ncbi:MAG TPA: type II secretion system F family protein [Tepidisphaeraceae bacterium]|nr:type II secretion system F family protein [Tepidisphaeraceae bacterium]